VGIGDETDSSAEMSRLTRTELLKHSLYETAIHPLFGVGPDQFAAQMAAEEREKGAWEPWLGTHDSYTQVSSECGVPALIFYVAVIGLCWRMNYRLFRTTQRDPKHVEINALSASLLSTTLAYSVCNFFFHMAYTATLPALAGLTLALYNSSRPILETDLGVKF
jgi:O-antigen ligase